MSRFDDPEGELADVVAQAAAAGPLTRDRARRFLELVLDGEQAHRPWAQDELGAIQWEGAAARFKRHWKPTPKHVPVGQIEVLVQTVVGVERDGGYQQLPMSELTLMEFRGIVGRRKNERDRLTNNLVALRRVEKFVAKHGRKLGLDATLADVLAAQQVSLLDVMAGAA